MTINAAPGSARHAPRNSHSAVAGSGTLRQCSRCRRREPRVRFHAAIALGRIGNPSALNALVQLARETKDEDPVLRHAAIFA